MNLSDGQDDNINYCSRATAKIAAELEAFKAAIKKSQFQNL